MGSTFQLECFASRKTRKARSNDINYIATLQCLPCIHSGSLLVLHPKVKRNLLSTQNPRSAILACQVWICHTIRLLFSPCRHRHAAALDWLVFLNAHGNVRDDLMYGNKDTFELAFALAGSHSDFHQLRIWPRSALSEQKHVSSTSNASNAFEGFTAGKPGLKPFPTCRGRLAPFAGMDCRICLFDTCGCLSALCRPTGWNNECSHGRLITALRILVCPQHRHNMVAHSVAAAALQDDTYWQVGLIQNTPTGQPAFWHRTSQPEKWVLDRDPSSMVRPRFVTPPLGLQATGTMQWNHEWQNVCFGEGRVVTDDQLECKNVDLASMLLIEQQDPDRSCISASPSYQSSFPNLRRVLKATC